MTATAIKGANIPKTTHSQQSGTFGTAYPMAVVYPNSDGNRLVLTESGNRLGNGPNREDGSECKNSADRMQLHVPLQSNKEPQLTSRTCSPVS